MDYTTVRTFSVIKIRNNFNRLAKGLIQKGQLDSAVAVLDRCVELMPKENVPYDLFTLDILETYYFLGENEKANIILSDFADISIQELNYYFSLPAKYSASIDYDIRLSVHYLQRLNEFSQRFGDPEIAVEIEAALNNAFNQYSSRNP
jgi:tetratricopeptide (TPR) repeat protein